ncbi:MAG: GNAT family N-acetyltransferase [Pseudomonadota bacterium]
MTRRLLDAPVLETERLLLRAPEARDGAAMEAFFVTERARWVGGPLSPMWSWRILAMHTGQWLLRGYGSFVLVERETGRAIGLAGPWHPGDWPEAEFAWSIWSPEDEGRGFAVEAMRRIAAHVWDDLGWSTAVSYIARDNARSAALAERLGARIDPRAARPPKAEVPVTVYRHPHPSERAA